MADDKNSGANEFFRQHYTTPDFRGAAKPRPKANGIDPAETESLDDAAQRNNPPTTHERGVNLNRLLRHLMALEPWRHATRYNELTHSYEVLTCFPPPAQVLTPGSDGKPVPGQVELAYRPAQDPRDILEFLVWVQGRKDMAKTNKAIAWDAIRRIAHQNTYHPVRDYLAPLQWDKQHRVPLLFERYFNASLPNGGEARTHQQLYLAHISQCFMIGAVARAMQPGCKVDHVPIIVSKQKQLKSSALRALCADEAWFTDNIPSQVNSKEAKEALRGKWLIELAEMPQSAAAVETLKAFVTTQADRYREAYGHLAQDYKRQGVFIATVNELQLKDTTGNRRFWPFAADRVIDLKQIEADRDQLWAEALHLYLDKTPWWLPPDVEAIAQQRQDDYVEEDLWDDLITEWTLARNNAPFLLRDLFAGAELSRSVGETTKAEQMRAASRLRYLGWLRRDVWIDGKTEKLWKKVGRNNVA